MKNIRPRTNVYSRARRIFGLILNHPANRGSRAKALGRAAFWQLRKRIVGQPVEVKVFGTIKFICYPDSAFAGNVMYFGSYYEWDELHFVQRYLRPGDNFIDVGANVGIYSLLAASIVGHDGSVEAIEAFPLSAERLERNLEINDFQNVSVHRFAAADHRGTIEFVADSDTSNRIKSAASHDFNARLVTVPCDTLEHLIPKRAYAMAKLDVEGAEPMVLAGAMEMLAARNPPVWQLEVRAGILGRHGFTVEQCLQPFRDHGYQLAIYEADSNQLTVVDDIVGHRRDILAIAPGTIADVRRRLATTMP